MKRIKWVDLQVFYFSATCRCPCRAPPGTCPIWYCVRRNSTSASTSHKGPGKGWLGIKGK